jgi:hypothetical protein
MRTLDEVVEYATARDATLRVNTSAISRVTGATVDGLFHVPLLALTILVIASSSKLGLGTADVGSWATATLMRHFEELNLSRGRLRWSILIRRRCADALVFLEQAGLIVVREAPERAAYLTKEGRDFVRNAASGADEIGVLTRQLRRAHRAAEHTGLELL